MTCKLGYENRPCTFQGFAAHYFITVYRDSEHCWAVRTEYHGPRGRRMQRRSNASAKHFRFYEQARTFAERKHAAWSAFPQGLPITVDLGEGIA